MAEGERPRARDQRRHRRPGPREELRHGGDRHGDVVLDRAALVLLHLRQRVADAPEGVRLLERAGAAPRPRRCPAPPPRRRSPRPSPRRRPRERRRRDLHEHVPGVRPASGSRVPGTMAEHDVDADPRDQLEGGEARRGLRLARRRGARSAAAGSCEPDEGDARAARLRKQPQHRRGDDAERSLGADEEVAEIVAGIVLAELAEPVPDLAGGEHDLDAEHQVRACCRRRAPRCRRHWSRDCRRSGRSLPRRATAGNSRSTASAARCASARMTPASAVIVSPVGIDLADAVEPRQRDDDLAARARPGSGRRPRRYCRPAARSASRSRWRA